MSLAGYTEEEIGLALASSYYFSKTFVKNRHVDCPIKLDEGFDPQGFQKKFVNIIDYGFDKMDTVNDKVQLLPTQPVEKVILLSPRQYGKTTAVIVLCTALLLRHTHSNLGIISNRADNAAALLKLIHNLILDVAGKEMVVSKKMEEMELANGNKVYSYGGTSESIRGKVLTWLLVDEAAQVPEHILKGAAYPTVATAGAHLPYRMKTPSIILTSTPRGRDNTFGEEYVKGLELREIGCSNCGNKRPIAHRDFSGIKFNEWDVPSIGPCPDCGIDTCFKYVNNQIASIRVEPYTEHPFLTPEQIRARIELLGIDNPLVRQEWLGEIISDDLGVYRRDWLKMCSNEDLYVTETNPRKGVRYVLSGDFGRVRDATCWMIGHFEKTKYILDHMKWMPAKGGFEYKDIRYTFLDLVSKWKPYSVILDANNVGDAIMEQVSDDLYDLRLRGVSGWYNLLGSRVEYNFPPVYGLVVNIYSNAKTKTESGKPRLGFIFNYDSKLNIITNSASLLSKGMCEIPAEYSHEYATQLWKELLRFGFSYTDKTNRIQYGTQNFHDDCVIAYALLLWGLREQPYIPATPKVSGQDSYVLQRSYLQG